MSLQRDGTIRSARWCAGCHDPAPFFSGAFDKTNFDDVNDSTAHTGISCVACHAITDVHSTRGNADYTIEPPIQYPFAYSKNPVLGYVNRQLILAKPEFHKATFLKPVLGTSEFCAACHKVSIPGDLNHYKEFLRGQNHYDSFLLSGVSGHNAKAFYYPPTAKADCNACHMTGQPSSDVAAKTFDPSRPGEYLIHDHRFAAANTALPALRGDDETFRRIQASLAGTMRVDLFALHDGDSLDAPLIAPLRPLVPKLRENRIYILDTVVRTLKVRHAFTQGTADSNETWLQVTATDATGRVIGRSGAADSLGGAVDPWAHFLNVYILDRNGNRIDRRNVQDIFTPLYDHQVPPGAARVVHYSLAVPPDVAGPITVEIALQYRKFDAGFVHYALGASVPDRLPITTLASDRLTFDVGDAPVTVSKAATKSASPPPEWERWNDYGIGLFLSDGQLTERGELKGAEAAFKAVETLRRPDGPINLARVYLRDGRPADASAALLRAQAYDAAQYNWWTVAWLTGLVDKQQGRLDEAIAQFRRIVDAPTDSLKARGFDFGYDYEVLDELGQTLIERAKQERGDSRQSTRRTLLQAAEAQFKRVLAIDSENVAAHYNLGLIYTLTGDRKQADAERALYEGYRVDDDARDLAVMAPRRRDAAAEHASHAIVINTLTPDNTSPSAAVGKGTP